VRPGRRHGDEQAREHARIARELEVIDAGTVGEAEVEARHGRPGTDRVVGDVLLVDVPVAREEVFALREAKDDSPSTWEIARARA
jgi:hypothetical protein